MAEILGTVVGVLSLGLQVCSGIIKYLDGLNSHRDDIASASRLCQTLQSRLSQMEAMQNEIAAAIDGTALAIDEAMAPVKAELVILSAFLDKVRTSDDTSRSAGERIRDGTKRAAFPFRRGHLGHLESHLREADRLLQAALQIDEVRIMMKGHAEIRNINTKLSSLNTEVNRKMDSMHQQSQHDVGLLSSEVSQISLEVGTYMEASTIQLSRIESQVSEVLQALHSAEPEVILRRILSKPSALQVICNGVGLDGPPTITTNSLHTVYADHRVKDNSFGCHCRPRRTRSIARQAFGPAFFVKERFSGGSHASDCPLAKIVVGQRYWSLGASVRVFRIVLTTAVAISMSTPFGAGGLGISPSFKAYFVYDNSPAATVINILRLTIGLDSASVSIVVREGIEVLQSLFATGKASPLDRDSNDKTLLHHACMLTFTQESSDITKISPLLDFLVRTGVPRDRPNNGGEFPFHQLLNWAAYAVSLRGSRSLSGHDPGIKTLAQDCRFLMPDDLTMIPDSSGRHGHGAIDYFLVYYEISLGSFEIAEWYGSFLHYAILRKDKTALSQIIQRYLTCDCLSETNTFGYTSLELLAPWTEGMKLVLDAKGDQILHTHDNGTCSVLCCALYWSGRACQEPPGVLCSESCHCTDSTSLLLTRNCRLTFDQNFIKSIGNASLRCKKLVIAHLSNRRKQLAELASGRLSTKQTEEFGLLKNTTLDYQTHGVICALEQRHFHVDPWLLTHVHSSHYIPHSGESVYFDIYRDECGHKTQLLDTIYKEGFREVDSRNIRDETPLMRCTDPGVFLWFVDHGADPKLQYPNRAAGYTPTHHFFSNITSNDPLRAVPKRLHGAMGKILQESSPEDACRCECSYNGCRPQTSLWNARFRYYRDSADRWHPMINLVSCLEKNLVLSRDFQLAVLRSATFDELSIRHTCCQGDKLERHKDENEIQELWDEDMRLIEVLRTLLPEFYEKLAELKCPLSEFLKTYWRGRMRQVCQQLQEQTLTDENVDGIKRLGISLSAVKEPVEKEHDRSKAEYWIKLLRAVID